MIAELHLVDTFAFACIFDTLATSASTNSGISTNVKMMGNYSHVGMLKARDRVPIHTFKKTKMVL